MPRILVVEDEKDLATLLEFNLRAAGHEVVLASTGAQALGQLRSGSFDLVLLDLMLPDVSGTEVARLLRADSTLSSTAIVMVTAKGQEQDRVRGLELGADDYVVKPFSVQELLLRVRAVLRRPAATGETAVLKQGRLELDSTRHTARADGQLVGLTALEFRLLKTLMERAGRVQTRETLLADVWGISADVTTRTVDTHIKRLREKLGPAGEAIRTLRGVGYQLADES